MSASRHSHWGHHYSPIGISADRTAPREESEGKSRYNVMARQKRQRAERLPKEAGGGAPDRDGDYGVQAASWDVAEMALTTE